MRVFTAGTRKVGSRRRDSVRLGLVVALPEEVRAVSRALGIDRRKQRETIAAGRSGVHMLAGRMGSMPLAIAWAGAGEACASRSAEALLRAGAEALLAVGFAGALAAGLWPGDLLLCTQVMVESGTRWPADSSLLEAMGGAVPERAASTCPTPPAARSPSLHWGPLVTLPRVVTTAGEKQRLGEETGALAVDMESAGVARCAAEARVPMAALRVITDDVDEQLPLDFNRCLDSDGQFHYGRLILLLARRPLAVGGLVRLGRHSAFAGRTLASFLAQSLPRLASPDSRIVDLA